jgi:hypothetical protein
MQTPRSGLACLTACLDGRPGRLLPLLPGSSEAWESLIAAAAGEFLLPALHSRVVDLGIQPPPEVAEFLAHVEELNGERNARLVSEMLAVGRLLNGIGIEPVALKGAAFLVSGVYPRPGCRYLCDIDLLVPATCVRDAAEVLENDGYRQDTRDMMAPFRHHYPQLQRPPADRGGSAPVELHHSLGHGSSRRLLSGAAVLRDSSVRILNGVRIRIPSEEHLLTHLIMHSQMHHSYCERIWPPLRAMYDLTVLDSHLSSRLVWQSVRRRFSAVRRESTLLLHLLHVRQSLGMPLPFEIELGPVAKARWARRQALSRWPTLRFCDPAYLVLSTVSRRSQFLASVVSARGGRRQAVRTLLRPAFYRRLLAEIALR